MRLKTNVGIFEFVVATLITCVVISQSVNLVNGGLNPVYAHYSAQLTGSNEIPPISATGNASIIFTNQGGGDYGIEYEFNLTKMLSEGGVCCGGITMTYVTNGTHGPVVAYLPITSFNGLYAKGGILDHWIGHNYRPVTQALLPVLNHHKAYINIEAQQLVRSSLPHESLDIYSRNVLIRGLFYGACHAFC